LLDDNRKHTFKKALELKELCSVVQSKCVNRIKLTAKDLPQWEAETESDLIVSPLLEKDRLTIATKMPQITSEAAKFWRTIFQEKVGLVLSISDSMKF